MNTKEEKIKQNNKIKRHKGKLILFFSFLLTILTVSCVSMPTSVIKKRPASNTDIKPTSMPSAVPTATLTPKSTITPIPVLTDTLTPALTVTPTMTMTPKPVSTIVPKPTSMPTPAASNSSHPLSYYEEQFIGDCFIGDSRTDELFMTTGISTADFLCKTGLNVKSAMNENIIWSALESKQYRNIYIEFGVNELGWNSLEYFEKYYIQLINKVKELQPEATIYVQSIIPVSQNKSDTSSYETLENVEKFNKRVINAANSTNCAYLDVTLGICGDNRVLPPDASHDGVHPVKKYNLKWLDYIIENR